MTSAARFSYSHRLPLSVVLKRLDWGVHCSSQHKGPTDSHCHSIFHCQHHQRELNPDMPLLTLAYQALATFAASYGIGYLPLAFKTALTGEHLP